ncbi:hypothetical protein [Bradyrhizobium sp. BR 1432]|uniref:hypothetical protein n=1 Tax=Bradyrhizobium sp. BR 1432 TaxID=3447966 RepID=UPI003EE5917E
MSKEREGEKGAMKGGGRHEFFLVNLTNEKLKGHGGVAETRSSSTSTGLSLAGVGRESSFSRPVVPGIIGAGQNDSGSTS